MYRSRYLLAIVLFLALLIPGEGRSPSAMYLILLGTGYPYPSADRAGPSCAVVAGERIFIVDAGRCTVMRLAATRIPWNSVGAVFLTHLHSDHIDGLPDLFHSTWQFGRKTPFELYGPKGTKKVAAGILQFYGPDIHIRRDLTERLAPEGARIDTHEIQEGVVYDLPGILQVTAFEVDHRPVKPAFGYRFDSGGHSIVITGDTRPNPNLIRFADGADILVHEAYVRGNPTSNVEKTGRWTVYGYHSSAREAGEAAEKAKVKILVLTHLMPADVPDRYFLDEAKKAFAGTILVGRDLMRIDPADAGNQ